MCCFPGIWLFIFLTLAMLIPRPLLIFSISEYLIQMVYINSHIEWQTVQIQISWLPQKPTDLDPHCLQRQGISGCSITRVKFDLYLSIFWIHHYNYIFQRVGLFLGSKLNYTMDPDTEIQWLKGVPPDKPACGYTGELCVEGKHVLSGHLWTAKNSQRIRAVWSGPSLPT